MKLNKITLALLFACSAIFYSSCQNSSQEKDKKLDPNSELSLRYATGFSVEYFDGYKIVTVNRPYMYATDGFQYILVEDQEKLPEELKSSILIDIPLKSIVCTSTTHIPLLDYLDEEDKLIGFPSTDYISSAPVRERIESGLVQELGVDNEMNIELLAELDPAMVMAYTIGGDYGQFNKISQLGIPTVINAEYLEGHPLGRAEWLKFMAAFFNQEEKADSIFNSIESKYLDLQSKVMEVSKSPSVISGVVYGDIWYLPGGQNYAAKLLRDAGSSYLYDSDSTTGFLEVSFEAVYDKSSEADFWIGVASFENLDQMKDADARYTNFTAFKKERVYTNNWRKGPKGGSEFLELGYLRPDIILSDLIKIFHRELLENDELYFHKKLD